MQIHELTALARNSKASDIHISEGLPLMFRIDGHLAEAPVQLSAAETRSLILSLMDEAHREAITSERIDADFALVAPDGTRSRVNVFYQQGRAAATLRLLNDSIPTLEELAMPPVLTKLADEPRGLILVTGPTGSGKSTMMYLLQRLYTPTSGKITIGGVDIQQIDRKYLRAHVGLILQEPFLYSKTIRENVGITAPEQEAERIEHAADIASASGFIAKADKGWETVVGERGVTLSGGQKQRIAIARTLLKDNNILIFDDSLSAVDTETDAQIRAALRHEQKAVTTLIISHRVTTLSQADLILVLENGQITQQGTHAELCSQPGLYQRINSIQNALEEELTQAKAAEGVN